MNMAVSRADRSGQWGTWGHIWGIGILHLQAPKRKCVCHLQSMVGWQMVWEWEESELSNNWRYPRWNGRVRDRDFCGLTYLVLTAFWVPLGCEASLEGFWILGSGGLPGGWRWQVRNVYRSRVSRNQTARLKACEWQEMSWSFSVQQWSPF